MRPVSSSEFGEGAAPGGGSGTVPPFVEEDEDEEEDEGPIVTFGLGAFTG